MRNFLDRHPKLRKFLHVCMATLGAMLVLHPEDVRPALDFFPDGSNIPRYIGYALGLLSFTNILVRKVKEEEKV